MESHRKGKDGINDSLQEFREYVQEKQNELQIIFDNLKIKDIIKNLTEKYQTELWAVPQIFTSIENIDGAFKKIADFLEEESQKCKLDKNLKRGLDWVLEWYRIKSIEIYLQPIAVFLSLPRTKEEEKKESVEKQNEFIKKIENISEDVRLFNKNLRKAHKEFKTNLSIDFLCDDLDEIFEPLIEEENQFESKIEESPTFKEFQKERDLLVKRITKLDIEILERIQVFTRSLDEARRIRLEKINVFLQAKDVYRLDVYYLQNFYEKSTPDQKQVIDAYKRISENNLEYERIRELKIESDKLNIPFQALLTNLSSYALSYLEKGYYLVQSGAVYLEAINKIANMLKKDTEFFTKKAKILIQMADLAERYEYFEKKFPEAKKIVESQYIELAAQYTKEIYNKKLIELKILEAEEKTNRRKEIHEFIQPFKLKVTMDDIDPLKFKQLLRRDLNELWKSAFDTIFKIAFDPKIKNFQIIKKNNNKASALRSAKQLAEELLQKKSRIFLKCINGLDANKKNHVQYIFDQAFRAFPLIKNIAIFIQETEQKLIEEEIKRKAEVHPTTKWKRVSEFFLNIARFLQYIFTCCKKPSAKLPKNNGILANVPFKSSQGKMPFQPLKTVDESLVSLSSPRQEGSIAMHPRLSLPMNALIGGGDGNMAGNDNKSLTKRP